METFGIVGGGIAGLAVARVLGRSGYQVTVFEPDMPATGFSADDAFADWVRPHIAQLRQPHSARSIIRKLLVERDPELYRAVLDGGMIEWPFRLPDFGDDDYDPELVGFLGRRPTFEKALRAVVERTPGVTFVTERVTGLNADPANPRRLAGVTTKSGAVHDFDAVVECTGRRSKLMDWLQGLGLPRPTEIEQDCGIIYYSRYFRFREGVRIDHGNYPSGPSANLSTLQYTMNRTDNGTFSLMLGVAPWEPLFNHLKDERVFMDVARALPGTMSWLAPELSEPIWRVEWFTGLVNRHRTFTQDGRPILENLFILGDSRFHTNPIFGWGMGLALRQSAMLIDALSAGGGIAAAVARFEAEADIYGRKHFEASAGEDRARMKYWKGELAEPQTPGTPEYFVTQVQPAAFRDPGIYRAVTRRAHLLDDPLAILGNDEVNRRAAAIPRVDHTKMSRAEIMGIVEASARRHLDETRLKLAVRA